jgi:hypothetical protein
METYKVKTSTTFAYFFEALKSYVVDLYATDHETGEPLQNVDQNNLSEKAQQQIFEVARQFWYLAKNHINVFVGGTPDGIETKLHPYYGPQPGPDCNTLDYFALRFASALSGCGLRFGDTIPEAVTDFYDENDAIENLEKIASLFLGEVHLSISGEDDMGCPILDFDCGPEITLRFGDISGFSRYPKTAKY